MKNLDESKRSIEQVLKDKKASPRVENLLRTFQQELVHVLGQDAWFARTHVSGITCLYTPENTPEKAFVFVNVCRDCLSARFFTGHGSIDGLEKANWLRGDDNSGSKTHNIRDTESLNRAISFARDAYRIAVRWTARCANDQT